MHRRGEAILTPTDDALQQKAEEPYYREAIGLDVFQTYFSRVTLNRELGKIAQPRTAVLRVVLPVPDLDGQTGGILVINVDFAQLVRPLAAVASSQTDVYLVNSDGDYLLHPEADRQFGFDLGKRYRIQDSFPDLAPSLSPSTTRDMAVTTNEDEPSLLQFQRVHFDPLRPDQFLGIALRTRRTHVIGDALAATAQTAGLLLIALLVGTATAVLLARRLVRPLASIAAMAPRLSAGEDVDWPSSDGRGDEIGVLSDSLREMALGLRQRAEAAEVARRRTHAILETAAEGIITIDDRGTVTSYNRAAAVMFGYEDQEVLGQNVRMLMPPEVAEQHDGYLLRYHERRGAVGDAVGFLRDVEGQHRDGSVFPMSLAVSKTPKTDGRVGFAGIIRDLTERRNLEAQLLQAQKLESVGQLAAGIAHEINTPIQFVGDSAHFLREAYEDLRAILEQYRALRSAVESDTDTRPALEKIHEVEEEVEAEFLAEEIPKALERTLSGVQRVASIVSAMKEFAHPGDTEKAPVDLNHTIKTTLTVARNEYKYVADVETEFGDIPLVTCSLGDISQVFLNLIVNAAHAIETNRADGTEKGLIVIRTRTEGDDVVVEIADTGGGIPAAIRGRVFDPFFTTKDVGKGTGQGLAIARNAVVEKHDGNIRFEVENGVGTTFFIHLPVGGEV